jgi:hypothetical protein
MTKKIGWFVPRWPEDWSRSLRIWRLALSQLNQPSYMIYFDIMLYINFKLHFLPANKLVVYTNWIGWFFSANWIGWFFSANWIGFKLVYICNVYFDCNFWSQLKFLSQTILFLFFVFYTKRSFQNAQKLAFWMHRWVMTV